MQHILQEITDTVDFLQLTIEEFQTINKLFYDVVSSKYPNLKNLHSIGNVKKCILTDDFTRVEFIVKCDKPLENQCI